MGGVCLILLENVSLVSIFKTAVDQNRRSVSARKEAVRDQLCNDNHSPGTRPVLPFQKSRTYCRQLVHDFIHRQNPLIGIRVASKTHSGN
jgi:hypothetical protein